VPLEISMPPLAVPRYPHMEWAYATGHSKKYASSGWASYDSHFFRWAEHQGYAVDLASQHELHFEPEILDGYDCAVFVGHDEYWTWEMRDAVDAYVDAAATGGALRRQLHVADAAGGRGPQAGLLQISRPRGRSGLSRRRRHPRDQFLGSAGDRPPGCADFRPQRHQRRLCRLGRLRAARRARLSDLPPRALGLRRIPASTTATCSAARATSSATRSTASPYVIRAACPSRRRERRAGGLCRSSHSEWPARSRKPGIALEDQFFGDEDGRFAAETLYGTPSDENLEKVKRGNGMIVNFKRGKGEVFHAGSCEWVAGLLREDAMVEKVTAMCSTAISATACCESAMPSRKNRRAPKTCGPRTCSISPAAPAAHRPGRGHLHLAQDGRRFIDGSSGAMVVNIGHGNRNVIDAMKRQMDRAPSPTVCISRTSRPRTWRAACRAKMPEGLDRIFFVSGGSEAVESALKLARQWAVVTGQGSAGRSSAASRPTTAARSARLSVTGDRADRNLRAADRRSMPTSGADGLSRPRQLDDGTARLRYADHAGGEDPRRRAGSVLAFIMEPIGGAATAALVAPDSYYPAHPRDLRPLRHPADPRRGDERHRPHREIPRRRPLELPPRHHHALEGPRLGLLRRSAQWIAHRRLVKPVLDSWAASSMATPMPAIRWPAPRASPF
jgi:hypothetical protein